MRWVRFAGAILVLALLCALAPAASAAAPASQDGVGGEFVAVDLDAKETVNGKTLMVIAYGVILGLFCLYGISLVTRERAVERQLADLKRRMNKEAEK